MSVIGVGCVLFRYADSEYVLSDDFDIPTFKKDVSDAIEKLEQVVDLEVYGIDDPYTGFRSFEENEDGIVFPIPCNFRLSFTLNLPWKVQVNYGGELDVEKFSIDIVYGYERPVMYVTYDDDGSKANNNPSFSVSVIRKFLADRISGKIVCDAIGPSPFHANFRVSENLHPTLRLSRTDNVGSGYAQLEISVPEREYATEIFIENFNETFSSFYYLTTQRNILINARRGLVSETRELLNERRSGFIKIIKSSFSMADKIDSIHKNTVEERMTRIHIESCLDEYASTDQLGKNTPLEIFFEEFFNVVKGSTWEEFSSVANFFEERRQKLFGNISVLIGGIIGGVIGALIGSTATFLLTASLNHQSKAISSSAKSQNMKGEITESSPPSRLASPKQ